MVDRDATAAVLCPDCAADHYEVLSQNGRFTATCSTCGKQGPEAGSLYEATQGWKQLFGMPAKSMSLMVWMIAGGLCLLGLAVAVIGLIAG